MSGLWDFLLLSPFSSFDEVPEESQIAQGQAHSPNSILALTSLVTSIVTILSGVVSSLTSQRSPVSSFQQTSPGLSLPQVNCKVSLVTLMARDLAYPSRVIQNLTAAQKPSTRKFTKVNEYVFPYEPLARDDFVCQLLVQISCSFWLKCLIRDQAIPQ